VKNTISEEGKLDLERERGRREGGEEEGERKEGERSTLRLNFSKMCLGVFSLNPDLQYRTVVADDFFFHSMKSTLYKKLINNNKKTSD
jgi:hypothetical protein